MDADKGLDILGLSDRSPGGGWSAPQILGIVPDCGLVPVALCGLLEKPLGRHKLGARMAQISFGDNVRVRLTPETLGTGLAAQTGQVYGVTTPSATNVEVIGTLSEDCAFNVHFSDRNESFWFAADMLELLDHAPGTEIRLDGIPKKWTRSADGSWTEETTAQSSTAAKPWWKFW